jgi:threonine dehydratase
MVVVEPTQADCLYQSVLIGAPTTASGSVDSLTGRLGVWRNIAAGVALFATEY